MIDDDVTLQCSGKMGFDSAGEAQNAAVVAAHQHGSKLKVYKCRKCDLWHLASNYGDEHDY